MSIRLLVTKLYDYKTQPKVVEYDFAGMKITESARLELAAIFVKLKGNYEWRDFGDAEVQKLKDLITKKEG